MSGDTLLGIVGCVVGAVGVGVGARYRLLYREWRHEAESLRRIIDRASRAEFTKNLHWSGAVVNNPDAGIYAENPLWRWMRDHDK